MDAPDRFEKLYGRLTRVAAFIGGLSIMFYETVADSSDRPWLYAAAIGMMGLPVARAAENLLGKISGADKPGGAPGPTKE